MEVSNRRASVGKIDAAVNHRYDSRRSVKFFVYFRVTETHRGRQNGKATFRSLF